MRRELVSDRFLRFCWAYPVGGGKWSEQAVPAQAHAKGFACTCLLLPCWRPWPTFRLPPQAQPSSCMGATSTLTSAAEWWRCARDGIHGPAQGFRLLFCVNWCHFNIKHSGDEVEQSQGKYLASSCKRCASWRPTASVLGTPNTAFAVSGFAFRICFV